MKLSGFQCDADCGATGVTKSHEARPEGWVNVYSDDPSYQFCSWACLKAFLNRAELPSRAVRS